MGRKRLTQALGFGIPVCLALAAAVCVALRSKPGAKGGASSVPPGYVTAAESGGVLTVQGYGRLRLLGVDVMECDDDQKLMDQLKRYGLETKSSRMWGIKALALARGKLVHKVVAVELSGEPPDAQGCQQAYITLTPDTATEGEAPATGSEEADFGLMLIQEGVAAARRDVEHARRELYLQAEATAQGARTGMWGGFQFIYR